MEKEINIAEILKNVPIGTKLYSPLFGDVFLKYIGEIFITVRHHSTTANFYHNGRLYNYEGTEPMLFPSREIRDWSKFTWKKGDILVSNDRGTEVIFDRWYDDTYTSFYGKHYLDSENENNIKYFEGFVCTTEKYFLEDKDVAQTYINTIEERLDGKLNRETLKIEKAQPEFKDGDIVVYKCEIDDVPSTIFIFRGISQRTPYYSYYASLDSDGYLSYKLGKFGIYNRELRLATDSEKQQFFDALAKEGKAWDSEHKMIVDLKPNVNDLRPFDKVLSRRCSEDYWVLNFYSHKTDYYHVCIDGSSNLDCIPYNEETAHLLGTTDEWKGGKQ